MSLSPSPLTRLAGVLTLPLVVAVLYTEPAWSQEVDGAAASLAITSVTVIDVRDGIARPDQTVVVEGERITAVGPTASVEIPAGARVVDGTGKFLIPGLWDMHVHFGVPFARKPSQELMMCLAHGVTGVRDLGAAPAVFQKLKEWRRRFRAGEVPGPRVHMAGVIIDGDPPGRSHYLTATNAEEGKAAVAHLQATGADFVKVYDGVPAEAFHAIVEEAEERGLAVSGHVPDAVGPIAASETGLATIEHADELGFHVSDADRPADPEADSGAHPLARMRAFERYDEPRAAAVIQAFAENGTAVVPTLHTVHVLARYDSADYEEGALARLVSESQKRERLNELPHDLTKREQAVFERAYRNLQKMLSRMHAEGVTLLAGSHAPIPLIPHGYGLHQELARLSEAGLGPADALRTATFYPARYLGRLDELGTVEECKLADLVLLDANPLEDIRHTREIRAVVMDGRLLDRQALDRMRAETLPVHRQDWSQAQQEVWEREVAYWEAVEAADVERFMTLWDDRFVGWPASEEEPVSRSDLRGFVEAWFDEVRSTEFRYDLTPPAVTVFDDIAITFYRAKSVYGDTDGGGSSEVGRLSHVWQKRHGEWKIIAGMSAPGEDDVPSPQR